MLRLRSMGLPAAMLVPLGTLLVCGSLALGDQDKPPATQPQTSRPAGSEKAVAAFQKAFPGAVLDEVLRPKDDLYAGAPDSPPLFWILRYHAKDRSDEAQITPDGVLVRRQEKLDAKGLPPALAKAVEKAADGATVKSIQRQETGATLKYAALEKPDVSYVVNVEKDGKTVVVSVQDDGKVRRDRSPGEAGEAGEKEEEKAPAAADKEEPKKEPKKEFDVPEEARRAVKAVKEIYPQAVVEDVENTAYDDGTGHVETIWFEVEFVLNGQGKTLMVTPEGVILHLDRPVDVKGLPKVAADAVAKEIAGGVIKSVTKREVRAGLKFVALDQPRVVYAVELESQGKTSTLKLGPDGAKIEPFNPWGRP